MVLDIISLTSSYFINKLLTQAKWKKARCLKADLDNLKKQMKFGINMVHSIFRNIWMKINSHSMKLWKLKKRNQWMEVFIMAKSILTINDVALEGTRKREIKKGSESKYA